MTAQTMTAQTTTGPTAAGPTRFAVCVRKTRHGRWEPIVHAGSREVAESLLVSLAAALRVRGARSLDFAVEARSADQLHPGSAVSRREDQPAQMPQDERSVV